MKNIVTWSDEDNSVVCWHISNQQELKHRHRISLENNESFINYDENKVYSEYIESKYSKNFGDIKNWFTVSDDKFVSMPIKKVYIKINYVSKTEEKDEMKAVSIIKEKTVTRIKIVESLAFLDGNKLIMISKDPLYRIYIFTKKGSKFIHQSTIKVETYNGKVFLSNGKLFIYDENLGSITKWDINTSEFEAYFLFDNSFSVDNIKLSGWNTIIRIWFTTFNVDAVYLIAPEIGARLLIVYNKSYKKNVDNYRCSICNPFAPYIPFENYVKANDLFKDFDLDGTLVIKDLIKDLVKDSEPNYKDWIFYLRNKLKDFNSIFISSISEQIIDLVIKSKQTAKEVTFDIDKKPQYSKYFVTWTLKYEYLYKNMHIFLTAEFKNAKIESVEIKSDTIQIVPAIYITSDRDVKRFVKECDCLDNDDLVMVTALGVLIWTFNTNNNKIELVYFWDDESDSWEWNEIEVIKLFYEIDHENFEEKNFDIKQLKKKSYFLPPPSYINMMRYNYSFSQAESLTEDRLFFNELIEKHINNKYFLILYGQKLVQDIIEEDEETLLRKLFNGCIEQIEKDNETLNSLIFNIFSQSITKIFKKNPSFFDDFVTQISLLCVLKVEKKNQILKHLHHYQYYIHISEIRKLISCINSDDWEESTKPIITKITKAINDEKQESEFNKIKKMIEKVVETRDKKQELEAKEIKEIKAKLEKVIKKQELEANNIQKILEKVNSYEETKIKG
ncbi:1570_t:CDS:2 [Gigaspora margarita]|uniref:1570_t:CDS:1 n=1 Tax=Gigaspora margarita TaxID=4874 RepID=A0ABN7VKB7_GIGMA|nr:1570_t:CDS:2 [Gigaspora margarita]